MSYQPVYIIRDSDGEILQVCSDERLAREKAERFPVALPAPNGITHVEGTVTEHPVVVAEAGYAGVAS